MNLDLHKITGLDFEFKTNEMGEPTPICVVKMNLGTLETESLWLEHCPEDVIEKFLTFNDDQILCTYYAQAELSCIVALNKILPISLIDLYVEFKNETNSGGGGDFGLGLIDALNYFGLTTVSHEYKDSMRDLIINNNTWTDTEKQNILDYCATDVIALSKLAKKILTNQKQFSQAIFRGKSVLELFKVSRNGIPVCRFTYDKIRNHKSEIIFKMQEEINKKLPVYENGSFKQNNFSAIVSDLFSDWPKLESGKYDLKDETFKVFALRNSDISELRDVRRLSSSLRSIKLKLDKGNRNVADLCPFKSKTGRNQPKSDFIYVLPSCLRSIIKPTEGTALIEIDFEQQEFGIAAALSKDEKMLEAYNSGDPYLACAKQAKAVPVNASKKSHSVEREIYKQAVIASLYGMGSKSFSKKINKPHIEATSIQKQYMRTYPVFWDWLDTVVNCAIYFQKIETIFGWKMKVDSKTNVRTLQNFMMQATGAEILRICIIRLASAGIKVCAPIHDALLIEVPLDQLDTQLSLAQKIMNESGEVLLKGFRFRTEAKIFSYPQQYESEKGKPMWASIVQALEGVSNANL